MTREEADAWHEDRAGDRRCCTMILEEWELEGGTVALTLPLPVPPGSLKPAVRLALVRRYRETLDVTLDSDTGAAFMRSEVGIKGSSIRPCDGDILPHEAYFYPDPWLADQELSMLMAALHGEVH